MEPTLPTFSSDDDGGGMWGCEAEVMEIVELRPHAMAAGGDAIARQEGGVAEGRVVFVRGALPGEVVRAELTESKKDFAKADVVEVVASVDGRREVVCAHARAGCGGCGWLHVDPALQIALKESIVADALRRTARLEAVVVRQGPLLSAEGFRTSLRVAADERGRFGFRQARAHDVVPVEHCFVAHPRLDELIRDGRSGAGTEVSFRVGTSSGERTALVEQGSDEALQLPSDVGVGPEACVHEAVAGVRFRISAASFFQTRIDGAEALVGAVGEAAGNLDGRTLVDAYAGVGLFGATVGAPAAKVVALEANRSSVADAVVNLEGRTIVKVDVGRWRPEPADVVIADPSRSGLGKPGVERLTATGAKRIVLVSCDPVAFARDARLLAAVGYELSDVVMIDLFPQTPHMELVSRFDAR